LARERGCVTYSVKEMFYTLQGEGARAGRPSVFMRFAGCNLWTGREQDRADAICQFCDTQFVGTDGDGGGKFETAAALARAAAGIDWICISPKAKADLVQTRGNELKLVFPQDGCDPARYAGLAFESFFLQPMDSPARAENTRAAIAYCLAHPQWRLSVQTHKDLGIR